MEFLVTSPLFYYQSCQPYINHWRWFTGKSSRLLVAVTPHHSPSTTFNNRVLLASQQWLQAFSHGSVCNFRGKKLHPMVEKKSFAPGLKHLNLSARHRSRPANCACTGKNWLMKMWNDRFFAKFMANTVDIIDIIIDIIWFTSTAIFPKFSKDHQTGCFHLQNLTKSTQNEVLLIDGEPIRNSPGDYATSHQVHSIGHNNIGC